MFDEWEAKQPKDSIEFKVLETDNTVDDVDGFLPEEVHT